MEKIGLIGAGAMGLALLERLRLAGADPVVYDSYPPALEKARAHGYRTVQSVAELAREAILIDVVVRTDEEVFACMTGSSGAVQNTRPGTLVLLHSTILPQTVRTIEIEARQKPVFVIDACMSGVPDAVRAGNLSFLVGGSDELVRRAEPHLLRMGREIFHMGPVGSGAVAKLVKNLVTGSETLILHEAIQMGIAGGIAYPDTLEMLRRTGHDSVLNRWQKTFDPNANDPLPKSGRNIMNKDIPLACELVRRYGLSLPITEQLGAAALRIVSANSPGNRVR